MLKIAQLSGLAALVIIGVGVSAKAEPFFHLVSATALKGKSPHWDYLSIDQKRGRLFIGRRQAGVTVFSLRKQKIVGHIAQSNGANMATLVPEFNRGYTTNEDGSTTVFKLSTLKTLTRLKLGDDADAAYYEPFTKTLAFMRGDSHAISLVDAKTAKIVGEIKTKSGSLEAAAADGKGSLFIAERDLNAVLKVDLRSRAIVAEWPVSNCTQATGIAFDDKNQRLFVGCRGDKPVLAVIDVNNGQNVVQLPIGRGNDGVIYDAPDRRIFASNGIDGNLIIYAQDDADHYRLFQSATTQPMARTMAYDKTTKALYLVTAQGAVDPQKKVNEEVGPFYPNTYFDDTFSILKYTQR